MSSVAQSAFTWLGNHPPCPSPDFFRHPKPKLFPVSTKSAAPPPGPLVTSACMCPLWMPYLSAITQYLSICGWLISLSIMSSRFIHIIARVSFPPSYGGVTLRHMRPVCFAYHLWPLGLVPSFGSYEKMLLGTRGYKYQGESLLSSLLSRSPEVDLPD